MAQCSRVPHAAAKKTERNDSRVLVGIENSVPPMVPFTVSATTRARITGVGAETVMIWSIFWSRLHEVEVAAKLQHRVLADRMVGGEEGAEAQTWHEAVS